MGLIVEQGKQAVREFSLDRTALSLGRGADNDVVLQEQGVSRHHARLDRTDQGWQVTDLSTNGTFINGRRLPPNQPYLLLPGDRIMIGSSVLTVQDQPPSPTPVREVADPSTQESSRLHPVVKIVGVLGLIVVLLGAVILLVVVLQPDKAPPTPTVVNPVQHMMTALPLPTEMQDIVTSVATLLPEGLKLPFLGGTATPTP